MISNIKQHFWIDFEIRFIFWVWFGVENDDEHAGKFVILTDLIEKHEKIIIIVQITTF